MSTTDLPEGLLAEDDLEFDDEVVIDDDDGNDVRSASPRRRLIIVRVFAPREPDFKRFRFKLDTLVGDAATRAARAFGYEEGGTPSFRNSDEVVLDRTITLRNAGVRNRDKLELVEAGGGV